MVKRLLILLMIVGSSAVNADEQKCVVRQPDGTLEIRHVDIASALNVPATLQSYLDAHEAGRKQSVEECIEARRRFSSARAREAEAGTPR